MERLFSPCTRLRDLLENQDHHLGEDGLDGFYLDQELELDVSTEELLSTERAFTYADLYAMLGAPDTVAWLTPHGAVALERENVVHSWGQVFESSCRLSFSADGKGIVAMARSREHLLEICHVVVRLLAASVNHSVILRLDYYVSINATSLAHLMEKCQSLKALTLKYLALDENHCRVLETYSRPNLDIVLDSCKLISAGTSALVEVLRRN
jgi:hypothetical protein